MSSLTGLSDSVSLGNQMLGDIRDENRGIIGANEANMQNYTLANQNEKSKRGVDDYWIGGSEGGALIGGIKNLVDSRKTAKAYDSDGRALHGWVNQARDNLSGNANPSQFLKDKGAPIAEEGEAGADTFKASALADLKANPSTDPSIEGLTGAVFKNEDNIPAVRSATSTGGEAIAKEGDSAGVVEGILGKTTGLTGDALKVGGKVLGNAGGILDTFEGVDHLIQSHGHTMFGKDEGTASRIGDITQMTGAALDFASMALPFLAPVAVMANVAGGIAESMGKLHDDSVSAAGIAKTSAEKQAPLASSQGWGDFGMIASAQSDPVRQIQGQGTF